jgi:hypothetical protein
MQLHRATVAALTLVGALALTGFGGCEEVFTPCSTGDESIGAAEKLDGIWAITTINNAPIPTKGYAVTSSDYLVAGSVKFSTRSVTGSCKDPEIYSGVVLVQYAMLNSAGQLQQGKSYTGSFDYNLERQTVLFRNSSRWIEGQKSGRSISVEGLVPSTWTNVSLKFTK